MRRPWDIPLSTDAAGQKKLLWESRALLSDEMSDSVIADFRTPRWYARRALPMLLANIGVWLPLVCIIYALPTPLQLPLQNIVLCFFTLMLANMSQRQTK